MGTNYYRHLIRRFCLTGLDDKEKWAAYRFTENVYDTWIPTHFKRICLAIEEWLNFDVSSLPETRLSQNLMQSDLGSASLHVHQDSQSSNFRLGQAATPGT